MRKFVELNKKVLKDKRCKQCKELFTPRSSLQYICCTQCALNYKSAMNWKKEKTKIKESLLKFSDYIKLFQITFNTFIRLRDKNFPCISCGRFDVEEFHCGHYIPSTFQYHRFNEFNCNKQCSQCNTHLRGNLIAYRINLIKKIGLEEVEYLENSRYMALEISIPEIKEQIKIYKQKIKDLK
jgi:hypothetical protein